MKTIKFFLNVLLIQFLCSIVYSQSGNLDTTFNPLDLGFGISKYGANDDVYAIAYQNDGKIIIGGSFSKYNGFSRNRIARLNNDGILDNSFNVGTGANASVKCIVIQNDGKIIIGGGFTSYNGTARNCIARLNSDGSIDNSFSSGLGEDDMVNTIVIQSDGKIIIGGDFYSYNGVAINKLVRLNIDGSLDNTFNPNFDAIDYIYALAIQSDGKIICGGYITSYNGTSINNIVRLNSDGTIDNSFNPGTSTNGDIYAIAVQNDGNIIIGGEFSAYNGISRKGIARISPNGSLDNSFNPGTGLGGMFPSVNTITIQNNGYIIIGGDFTSYNGDSRTSIARISPDGSLDNSFNPNLTGQYYIFVSKVVIQPDEKILIGGNFIPSSETGHGRNKIARLENDGLHDVEFNPGTGIFSNYYPEVYSIAKQSDGKIIIAGSFSHYNGVSRNNIVRINPDGTIDNSFNPGSGTNGIIYAIAIQNDGKIIIGGNFTSYNNIVANRIARLNIDGSLDNSFLIGSGANNNIKTINIQNNGRIVIGGDFTSFNGTNIYRIAQLNSDGTIDNSFLPTSGANNSVFTSCIQSDGKIIIGGNFSTYNGFSSKRIVRINTDGSIDNTFYVGSGANGIIYDIALQNDGKIIIAGEFTLYNGNSRNGIARINSDGTIDNSFTPGTGASNKVYSIAIQSDNKIIIGGEFYYYNNVIRNCIARLNSNGTLDTLFNPGTSVNISNYSPRINKVCLQNDGKIIIGGFFTSYNGTGRNYVARILNSLECTNTYNTINATACDSYTLNGQTYTATGSYTQTMNNAAGCDSIITLNLTIKNSTTAILNETACDSYTLNGQTYTATGTYTQHLTNAAGCDSTITLNLFIKNSTTATLNETACDSYTLNGQTYTASGTYTQLLTNAAGCDSIITLNLTIIDIDTSVTVYNNTITANQSGATYQWLDCNNGFAIITGATSQSFTATDNGNYAVKITQGSCSDTSACVQITTVGIVSLQKEAISIYPNPFSDELSIELKGNKEKIDFEIVDVIGKVIFRGNLLEKSTVETSNFTPGVYLIKFEKLLDGQAGGKTFEFKKIIKE